MHAFAGEISKSRPIMISVTFYFLSGSLAARARGRACFIVIILHFVRIFRGKRGIAN